MNLMTPRKVQMFGANTQYNILEYENKTMGRNILLVIATKVS